MNTFHKFHNFYRFVVTTASLLKNDEDEDDKARLILNQEAEKDVDFCFDSEIVFEAFDETLVMTTTVQTDEEPVTGTRTFSRYNLDQLMDQISAPDRRPSFCLGQNRSRRGSFATNNRRGSEEDHREEILQKLGARSRRRSSVAKVPEHLLPLIVNTEASDEEIEN